MSNVIRLLALSLSAMLMASVNTNVFAGSVDPPSVKETLAPGGEKGVGKTVQTPTIPPKPDIVLLSDTTGSMGSPIASVRTNAATIVTTIQTSQPDAQFAVAEYKDRGASDPFDCRRNQQLTGTLADIQNGINQWVASGGGDLPEGQLTALAQIPSAGTDCTVDFRENSTRVIVWFGDAYGKDPSALGYTEPQATTALTTAKVKVLAINVGSGGLDATGQATRITTATGGTYYSTPVPGEDVAQAILDALSNLPITVKPVPNCAPLNVSFDPAQVTVTSGELVAFTETIAVPSDPDLAGKVYSCQVDFQDENGNSIGKQDITIEVPLEVDVTPNTATNEACIGGNHTVTASVTSDLTVPLPYRTVQFNVTVGPNAGSSGSQTTDSDGKASFSYAGKNGAVGLGTDTIEGCVDVDTTFDLDGKVCDEVTKTWSDTTPPQITSVTANPNVLWPPNHKMKSVAVTVAATDACDAQPDCKITQVTSNELENGLGDGDTAPDFEILPDSPLSVNLRSERSGTGNGRVYTLTVQCVDDSGNSSAVATTTVTVPHDQGKNN